MFILNTWYVAALSSEITDDGLHGRTVADIPVLVYRTAEGELTALEDRCPHRQAPLSKGNRQGDEVECWYHGMRFDASGVCVHIPSQGNIPEAARTKRFPVQERYGFVWVWLGDPALAEDAEIPDYWFAEKDGIVGAYCTEHANGDYRFGIDNFMDSSHVAFVHPDTAMSEAVSTARPETSIDGDTVVVRRVLTKEKSPPIFEAMMGLAYIDRVQDLVYRPVCNTVIETTAHPPDEPEGQTLRTWTIGIFVPEREGTANVYVAIFRDFEIDNEVVQQVAQEQLVKIVLQDIDVVQHAAANWDDSLTLVHVTADQGSNAARRIIKRLMEQEAVSGASA